MTKALPAPRSTRSYRTLGYSTVREFAAKHRIELRHRDVVSVSMRAANECRRRGIGITFTIGEDGVARNQYPASVLRRVLKS